MKKQYASALEFFALMLSLAGSPVSGGTFVFFRPPVFLATVVWCAFLVVAACLCGAFGISRRFAALTLLVATLMGVFTCSAFLVSPISVVVSMPLYTWIFLCFLVLQRALWVSSRKTILLVVQQVAASVVTFVAIYPLVVLEACSNKFTVSREFCHSKWLNGDKGLFIQVCKITSSALMVASFFLPYGTVSVVTLHTLLIVISVSRRRSSADLTMELAVFTATFGCVGALVSKYSLIPTTPTCFPGLLIASWIAMSVATCLKVQARSRDSVEGTENLQTTILK